MLFVLFIFMFTHALGLYVNDVAVLMEGNTVQYRGHIPEKNTWILGVLSTTDAYGQRQRHRKLFKKSDHGASHYTPPSPVFLIANTFNTEPESLSDEMFKYKDILIFNMDEKYTGVHSSPPKKVFGFFNAIIEHTNGVKYIMKADDDLHLDGLIFVQLSISKVPKPFVYGKIDYWNGDPKITVNRDKASKWYVSPEWYNKTEYPPYPSGIFYAMDYGGMKKIVQTLKRSQNPHILNLPEDAVVGILANESGVDLKHGILHMKEVLPDGNTKPTCRFSSNECRRKLIYEFIRHEGNPPWPKARKAFISEKMKREC